MDKYRGLRTVYDRQCFRGDGRPKRQFVSAIAAHNATVRAREQGEMTAYRCDLCGMWHIGHPPKARAREEAS